MTSRSKRYRVSSFDGAGRLQAFQTNSRTQAKAVERQWSHGFRHVMFTDLLSESTPEGSIESQEEPCDCWICQAEMTDEQAERLAQVWGDTSTDTPFESAALDSLRNGKAVGGAKE